jgi:formylglycine-generating enzyme required for sulfatase activity
LRNKWFERRHLQHQIARWNWDHSAELHQAWMNGSGMMVWENVFGQWVGWNKRDRSILRTMVPIQRQFAGLFAGEHWTPLVPADQPNVFASEWGREDLRLWTLVNRGDATVEGPLLAVVAGSGQEFFDLVAGRTAEGAVAGDRKTLSGRIGPRGIGCFLAATERPRGLEALLANQRALLARDSSNTTFPRSEAVRLPVRPSAPRANAPEGMAKIPGARLSLQLDFRIREVGFYKASPEHPATFPRLHENLSITREVTLQDFAIDLTPVTNRQFAAFLQASGYSPSVKDNFLKHWPNGKVPADLEEHPVVFVTIEDARAYAGWAGKRLPTEDEWQYAAQGPQALAYPWGNEDDVTRRNGGEKGGTTPVRAYPEGRSPFGVCDLCGNVWELTESEHTDARNRFVMLKGGSYYEAKGSGWYFDGGPRPNRHVAKMLLFWPGLDRCATVGFRCAADLS